MQDTHFHAGGRHATHGGVEIELLPTRTKRLRTTHGGQDKELERQASTDPDIRSAHLVEGRRNVGMWESAIVLGTLHRAQHAGKQLGGSRIVASIPLGNRPLENRANALAGAGNRTVRAGTRWQLGPNAVLNLEATRQTSGDGGEGDNQLMLRAALRF